jgi:protein-S-isoprenylcysteine O-methyltransferase Ste14
MMSVMFAAGIVVAAALLGGLVVTLLVPSLRFWPTPGEKTWQSYAFWPLFRGLNVLCFAVALAGFAGGSAPYLGLPNWLRFLALVLLIGSVGVFVYAFRVLGRDNSYGADHGLVTSGIYQWTRNPQNAMLIVVYGALALAADHGPTYGLCLAMMAAYALMVLAEEPWLEGIYGEPYLAYCRQVPRFFAWRRVAAILSGARRG